MEEEVTQKTIALTIRTTKLTADVLRRAFQKFLAAQRQKHHNPYKLHIPRNLRIRSRRTERHSA